MGRVCPLPLPLPLLLQTPHELRHTTSLMFWLLQKPDAAQSAQKVWVSTQSAATVRHREQGVSAPVPSYVFVHSEGFAARFLSGKSHWHASRTLQRGDTARTDLRQAGA